jgi:hypothetical protein
VEEKAKNGKSGMDIGRWIINIRALSEPIRIKRTE